MTMADKLTWQEIKNRYPDEWVMVVDYERPEDFHELFAGIVFDHDKNRKQLLARTKEPLTGKGAAIRFTGEIGKGHYLF